MADEDTITEEELAEEVSRAPVFSRYPSLVDGDFAMRVAWEKVCEWSYEADAHGWCHERPIWLTLIAALRAKNAEVERARFVAQHWAEAAMKHTDNEWAITAHALAMVQAALAGETDPVQCGLDPASHTAFRAIASTPRVPSPEPIPTTPPRHSPDASNPSHPV